MSTPGLDNRSFLEGLFAEMLPGAFTIICGFRGDPNISDREQAKRNWCGRPWKPGEPVPSWFDRANCYLTVSSFEPDPMTGECRRRKEHFVAAHTIMVDDVGTKVPHERLALSPSALIETSPGNLQAFYFLTQGPDTRDRPLCERLVTRMVAAGLAIDSKDPGMTGVTRYARLPCGINTKAKCVRALGHPFQVRCALIEPSRRYTVADIAAAWKLDLTPNPPRARVVPITPYLAQRAGERFEALIEVFKQMGMYRGQHGVWHDVTCPWVSEHTDRADTGAAISEPSAENAYVGGFVCHHGHCREHRSMRDVRVWLRALVRELDKAGQR
jgi:hypothetical protein